MDIELKCKCGASMSVGGIGIGTHAADRDYWRRNADRWTEMHEKCYTGQTIIGEQPGMSESQSKLSLKM